MGNHLALILAQGSSGTLGDLTPLYYGLSILVLICSGLWALKKYSDNQKQDSIQRAIREQALTDKLDANTRAADKNSTALERLGEKFDTFSSAVDKRLTLLDYRVDKAEEDVKKCTDHNGNKSRGGL